MTAKKKTEVSEASTPAEKAEAEKQEADAAYLEEFPMSADELRYLRKNVLA